MKKKLSRRVGVLALCAALLCGGVFAANTAKTIEVQYMDIKLVVDGVQVTPKDANGAVVEPFVYNGTTYLPVRAIGEALGKEVDWDGNTRTVYVGKVPGKVSENYLEPYESHHADVYESSATNYFTMMGKKYTQGLALRYGGYGYYNLDGKYSRVEFDIGHADGSEGFPASIYVYLDGEVIQEFEVTGDMQTKHISIPVNYGLQLKLVKAKGSSAAYGLANLRGIE